MSDGARRPAEATPDPPAAPLRVLQVGAGAMGRSWLRLLAESPEVELVGLVDLDQQAARSAAEATGHRGVAVAGSLGELLPVVDAEAVLDITVPAAHAAVSREALRHGLPVLGEKPLAESVSAGLGMVAAAERSGQLLAVSQSRRHWRQLTAFRGQISRLGDLGLVSCQFFRAPRFGGFRDAMAFPLLVDMAIHQFDLARDLMSSEPVEAFCVSSNPPWSWYAGDAAATAVFRFADGARFTFDGSWCSPGQETSWNGRWRLATAAGSVVWDGDHAPTAERADGSDVPGTGSEAPEQITGSLAEFVRVLRDGGVPSGEVSRNVLSVAMVDAAIASAGSGRWVRIADLLETAHGQALAQERVPAVREVLAGWPSVSARVGLPAAGAPDLVRGGSGDVLE